MSVTGKLRAGVGRSSIAPDEPTKMKPTGMGRLEPTRGVLLPLTVEALAISVGGELAFVLSGDLRYLPFSWVVKVREQVAQKTQCDPKRILFGCRHNHCSNPEADPDFADAPAALERALEKIVNGITQACLDAHESLREAEMASFGCRLKETIGEVRRLRLGDGTVVQCWGSGPVVPPGMKMVGPYGPQPVNIDALAFREPGAAQPFALFTSYPAHTHLYELPYFSGEPPTSAILELEKRIPGLTHIYSNGAGGNIDMHFTHPAPGSDIEAIGWFLKSCAEIGRRFAEPVEEAIRNLRDQDYVAEVRLAHTYWSKGEDYDSAGMQRIILNALTLNDSAIVSIPGEIFFDYEAWMEERNPFGRLLFTSYNGSGGPYVGTPLAFEQGGYEVMRGPAPPNEEESTRPRPESGQEISEKVIEMLQSLKA